MPDPTPQELHARFARALAAARQRAGLSQEDVGVEIVRYLPTGKDRLVQSAIQRWERPDTDPPPRHFFDMVAGLERVLRCTPGELSGVFGYQPVGATVTAMTVPDAIDADPKLSAREKAALRAAYYAFVPEPDPNTKSAGARLRHRRTRRMPE